jgi:hypothetical protein
MHLKNLLAPCLVAACLLGPAAVADRVTPSDRVESRLRIREAPDGDAVVVGFLMPGESLPLRTSVPSWHEIELASGISGFVSKSWSRVVPDGTLPVASSGVPLRLGAWNIRKLGHGSSKNFDLVASIITANFDIVAVVEVMQKGGGHPGYDDLLAAMGPDWGGIVTSEPRPVGTSGSAEFYAVLMRESRVRLCNGWTALRYASDATDAFSREPAFACFVAMDANGAAGFDFLLAAYHARFAEGDILEIQDEVEHINQVIEDMRSARPGEQDILIAGDFNLVSSDLTDTLGRPVQTIGSGSTLNSSGSVTNNLYDHLVAFDHVATSELLAPEEVIDVRSTASSNQTFFQTVSDHLPIVARFRAAGDDD